MKKWEYKVHKGKASFLKNEGEHLDELGQEGWELVAVTFQGFYYFKRELK